MDLRKLLPVYLGAVIGPMGGVGVITILPVLAKTWDIGIQWASLTITLYMIPYVIFQLFSGSIAHVFETRKTLLFGFSVYSFGGLLSGLAPSMATLIGARVIQGFGAAFIAPIVMALVGEIAEEKKLGRAMGVLGMMYTIGVTMGPLISGLLEVYFGWSWFFFFLSALSAATGILFWVTGLSSAESPKSSGRILDALPLIKRSFSLPDVRFLSFAAFCLFLAYIGLMTFAADFLEVRFALPSNEVGFILSVTGFAGITVSPVAGIFGDRFGRKVVAYAGGAIMIAALIALELVDYTYARYVAIFSFFGAGSSSAWISLNTLAVMAVPELRKPVASVYNSLKFSGYALAPVLLSFLYVPFSIGAVRRACLVSIMVSLLFASRLSTGHSRYRSPAS